MSITLPTPEISTVSSGVSGDDISTRSYTLSTSFSKSITIVSLSKSLFSSALYTFEIY